MIKKLSVMMNRALELGINFVDLYLPNLDFRDNLGLAIAGKREKFCLQGHIGAAWENGQYLRTRDMEKSQKAFDGQLERLGTEYLDGRDIIGTNQRKPSKIKGLQMI